MRRLSNGTLFTTHKPVRIAPSATPKPFGALISVIPSSALGGTGATASCRLKDAKRQDHLEGNASVVLDPEHGLLAKA
jgi:hypothetical protein